MRSGPSPVTSYTLTGSLTPLTLVGPSGLNVKYPSPSLRAASLIAIDPGCRGLHPRRQVDQMPDRSVLGVRVVRSRSIGTTTSPVFTPDADLQIDSLFGPQSLCVAPDLLLHR